MWLVDRRNRSGFHISLLRQHTIEPVAGKARAQAPRLEIENPSSGATASVYRPIGGNSPLAGRGFAIRLTVIVERDRLTQLADQTLEVRRRKMTDRVTLYVRLVVVVAVLVSLVLSGCAAKKYVVAEKPEGQILEYRMQEGKMLKYKNTQDSDQTMEMMGMSIETSSHKALEFSMVPKGGKDDAYEIEITIDAMDASMTSPQGELSADVDAAIGQSFTMTLSRLGKEIDVAGAEAITYSAGPQGERNLSGDFQAVFPDLPEARVGIGDTWTTQDTISADEGGISIRITSESVNTVVGFEPVVGLQCAKVTAEVTGEIKGEGEQQGAQVSFEGTLSGTETWYFAYEEGVLVETSSDIFTNSTIQVTGPQEMTIPMKQKMSMDTALVQ
jgi:hypothetical protein